MKTLRIILALMLLCSVSVWAQEQHNVISRSDGPDVNKNGTLEFSPQSATRGQKVKVYCNPKQGYGLSRGPFYATKLANGTYSDPVELKATSPYPEDRANKTEFEFTMPDANVYVWAFFTPVRTLIIHKGNAGKLIPLYGFEKSDSDTILRNVPLHPIKLRVEPKTVKDDKGKDITYELLDLKVVNLKSNFWDKSTDSVTIKMPDKNDTVHVTPIFARSNYNLSITGNPAYVKVEQTNPAPKGRDEVEVILRTEKGYIPKNISFSGCKSWWRVGKPQREEDGGWKVVYHVKFDFKDVTLRVNAEKVYDFSVNDTKNTGRLKTYIPEVIPDYPGVAREDQKVPVVFRMPKNYSVTYTAKSGNEDIKPTVYHNALTNSFADQNMYGWAETMDYVGSGLAIMATTDSTGNKFWRTSTKNSMSQRVKLSGNKGKELSIATLVSMNPRRARRADVSIVTTTTDGTTSELKVADMMGQEDSWQTEFNTHTVPANADELKFVVSAEADNPNRFGYDGPMFDDLCLLLPISGNTIKDEDVMVFEMGNQNVTINYTPSATQATVTVSEKAHATVTLINNDTGEQGTTIKAMEGDLIIAKGTYEEGNAIFGMQSRPKTSNSPYDSNDLQFDSVKTANHEVYYHHVMRNNKDITITPTVDKQQVYLEENYGGSVSIKNAFAKEGEKVQFTVTPDSTCKLKQIKSTPDGIVTIKADSVDAATGAGHYSFIMTTNYLTLIPEFIVPISSVDQLTEISRQNGDFNLTTDLDLGNNWEESIKIFGNFNGNGHRITYSGNTSLFANVAEGASVRHLYVNADVNGSDSEIGGITLTNSGVIEDCVVTGTVKNTENYSYAGGIAGKNDPMTGTISRCHVQCNVIDAPTACGIAYQSMGATIKDNVFNGKFNVSDGDAYLICNDDNNSTINGNYYIANDGNARADSCQGVTAGDPAKFIEEAQRLAEDYPVFAASLRAKYKAYTIDTSLPGDVRILELSGSTSIAGAVISGSVRVTGNRHLDAIIVSDPDGNDARSCSFTDNTQKDYFFSFTMPEHDVLITFKTQEGELIYTVKQLANINYRKGTYILARDLNLSNWNKSLTLEGHLYGRGHTIKYQAKGNFKGLFTKVLKGAVLEGLRVVATVESEKDCAGIAFDNQGIIRDCHFCGTMKKIQSIIPAQNRVAAIAYKMGETAEIDHCSATGELISPANQQAVNDSPLCPQKDANMKNSIWVDASETGKYQELFTQAETARQQYPVFAQGIFDKISASIITGTDTVRVMNGTTLDELTITDGIRFVCTADTKVNKIIYKRPAMRILEQWILPFSFNNIAGSGTFEYHPTIEEKKLPDILPGQTLTLTDAPSTISYQANTPWLVKSNGSGVNTYVLTNADGPITLKSTNNDRIAHYASVLDEANFYAAYDSIPAATAKEEIMYSWDVATQAITAFGDSLGGIQPFRYYLQFYNQNAKKFEKYEDTWWAKDEAENAGHTTSAAPRRASEVMADGWQPIFLDPRQPQSVTARMLDYYDIAYLADVRAEELGEGSDVQVSDVSLIYQMVDSRMELPTAIPMLVRAKRSDAEPLVDRKTGTEIDSLMTQALIRELMEEEDAEEDTLTFEMPHYWCASLSDRLDVWHLPSPEKYAELADFGCMMFTDDYFDQSFKYATASDTRTTTPMSYCITVLNADRLEVLPLMGDRVNVEFVGSGEATGIDTVQRSTSDVQRSTPYNLSGQRVSESYKGIIIQNGRKVIKR